MREIKFKGKRVDNGEWIYGYFVKCEWKSYIEDCNNKTMNPRRLTDNDADFRCLEVIPETVGQYTGLKDKQGKEVYEGDIVKDRNGQILAVRLISLGMWYWWLYKKVCDGWEQQEAISLRGIEVIGNIYDNPELLEAKA